MFTIISMLIAKPIWFGIIIDVMELITCLVVLDTLIWARESGRI